MFFASHRSRALPAVFLLLAFLVAACGPGNGDPRHPVPANAHLLLAEVYSNGFAVDGSDQFVRLHNPLGQAVDLEGWSVGDTKQRATFPVGARIGPGQALYIARDLAGFQKVMGAPPDYVWAPAGDDKIAPGMKGGVGLLLGRSKGAVILRDSAGAPVDALVYGESASVEVPGWTGPAVPSPIPGEVIDRRREEASWNADHPGFYSRDTDAATDWRQGDTWVDQRVLRPGQTWLSYPTYSAAHATAYASPDNSYRTVSELIDRAQQRIEITLYDFTLVPFAQKLAAAARRGVKVRLLMEAGSFKQLYDAERYAAKLVAEAGGDVRWIVNDPSMGINGRYVYNHAKYGVIDGKVSFIQSENMVRHGVPTNPSFGNRGWGIVLEDAGLAAYLARVFEADWNPAYGDTIPYKPGTPMGPPKDGYVPDTQEPSGRYPHPFPSLEITGPVSVTPVLAPDHSLLDTKGIIGLMRSAKESLLIEQQYIQIHCGKTPIGLPLTVPGFFRPSGTCRQSW